MSGKKAFTVYVYKDDYEAIQKMVQHYPNIETGGDLFGLWQDDETVVIQLFIGPGKGCRRTTTSFHQDIDYLAKVGSVITKEEGLCNVGEWHSHHQIGMPGPSSGDNRTVLSNLYQLGLERFVLFIASIKRSSGKRSRDIQLKDIQLNCFMFKEGLRDDQQPIQGKIRRIDGDNPFKKNNKAAKIIKELAEPVPNPNDLSPAKEKRGKEELYGAKQSEEKPATSSAKNDENVSPNGDVKSSSRPQGQTTSQDNMMQTQYRPQGQTTSQSKTMTTYPYLQRSSPTRRHDEKGEQSSTSKTSNVTIGPVAASGQF